MEKQYLNKIENKTNSNKRRSKLGFNLDYREFIISLLDNNISENQLINYCIMGNIPEKARSIIWKIFLNLIPLKKPDEWIKFYEKYNKIFKNKLKKCLEIKENNNFNHENSQKESFKNSILNESDTNQLYEGFEKYYLFYSEDNSLSIENLHNDNDIYEASNLIKLDIERTFQEIDLFKSKEIKENLCKVLYIWYRENKDIGYKQGMNEILATILYASFNMNESEIFDESLDNNEKYSKIFQILESDMNFPTDLYLIFDQLMKLGLKSIYNYYNTINHKDLNYFQDKNRFLWNIEDKMNIPYNINYELDTEKFFEKAEYIKIETKTNNKIDYKIYDFENMDKLSLEEILILEQSDLRRRVNIIYYYYLKNYDYQLYMHLSDKMDPYIIVFRWILCIFNREIHLNHVLYLWDSILALEYLEKNSNSFMDSFIKSPYKNVINNLNFINFLCVSIFEEMREELLREEDHCYILQLLMHFPNERNVKELVKIALRIRKFIYEKLKIMNEFVFIE